MNGQIYVVVKVIAHRSRHIEFHNVMPEPADREKIEILPVNRSPFQRNLPPKESETLARRKPMSNKPEILTPDNSQLIFIDHQPQMAFGVQSIDRQTMKNNTVMLAKAAKLFGIPTTITTVETDSFSGNTYPELLEVFSKNDILERTSMNSWDDQKVRDALEAAGRKNVIVSGLWTGICNNMFAFSAMAESDYDIFIVEDASGDTSPVAQNAAMRRMEQAGVVPMTTVQTMLEWQRDWAKRDTYYGLMSILREHAGAYGMGIDYAYTHVHKAPARFVGGERLDPIAAGFSEAAE